jgi:hypothetical protein
VLGTLMHCTLALPNGQSQLVALTHMVLAFGSACLQFSCWILGLEVLADIQFWRAKLAKPFCSLVLCCLLAISPIDFWVDTSTSFGIGVVFDRHWIAWQLRNGWKLDRRKIGWAEMIAIELGLRVAIDLGHCYIHFQVHSDNTSIIGSVGAGKVHNIQQNWALQRITALMCAHGLWVTLQYIPSAENMANAPSRGLLAAGCAWMCRHILLPECLSEFVMLLI